MVAWQIKGEMKLLRRGAWRVSSLNYSACHSFYVVIPEEP